MSQIHQDTLEQLKKAREHIVRHEAAMRLQGDEGPAQSKPQQKAFGL